MKSLHMLKSFGCSHALFTNSLVSLVYASHSVREKIAQVPLHNSDFTLLKSG